MADSHPTRTCTRKRLARHALALAVGTALAGPAFADAVSGFRLVMDDAISSRDGQVASGSDGSKGKRMPVEGLVQSHPDPVFVALQERYRALPPFTQAEEEAAEVHVGKASAMAQLVEGMWELADGASGLVADIKTSVRYDDRHDETGHTTTLATVNPGFQYQLQARKWKVQADYDYVRGQYFMDRNDPTNDHTVDLSWTYRPVRGRELSLSTLYARTHDRSNNDPIKDFDSALDPPDADHNRHQVELRYKHGTLRDRTRLEAYALAEKVSFDADGVYDYDLNRNGFGGSYTWQMHRQLALVGEMRYLDFDYDEANRNYSHSRYLTGTDIILGRRLRAKMRIGYDSVDSQQGEDTSEPVWSGMVEWALRRNSFLRLESGRELFDYGSLYASDPGGGDIIEQDWVRTSWKERWTRRLSTEASFTHRQIDGEARDEDANQLLVSANYQFTERLRFAVDAAYTQMDRTFEDNFSRRTLTFRADYSL